MASPEDKHRDTRTKEDSPYPASPAVGPTAYCSPTATSCIPHSHLRFHITHLVGPHPPHNNSTPYHKDTWTYLPVRIHGDSYPCETHKNIRSWDKKCRDTMYIVHIKLEMISCSCLGFILCIYTSYLSVR